MGDLEPPVRGTSTTTFRVVRCKDCLREQAIGKHAADRSYDDPGSLQFEYSEAWASRWVDRGGSRTDRCLYHRQHHRQAIQGIAVPYIDVQTIGEVADRRRPSGPLGGLGELPAAHLPKPTMVDLAGFQFGMTDADITAILGKLADPAKRVLILKAGTGTGKSTFGPFRLMSPPPDPPIRLTDSGPIIVTEPRVQATIDVSRFVGEKLVAGCPWKICRQHGRFVPKPDQYRHPGPLTSDCMVTRGPDEPWDVCNVHGRFISEGRPVEHPGDITADCDIVECSEHIGPGYPVGYQVKGAKNHDESCQLVYVTDGTMINWLREGRLNKIGTVIVDEAHERSTNIDFILGYLRREMERYPHLRVIVTSATFDVPFYVDYFGGPDKVDTHDVPPSKPFGYGAPLFPITDAGVLDCSCDSDAHPPVSDYQQWRTLHWPKRHSPELADGDVQDLWETTDKLHAMRFTGDIPPQEWKRQMPDALAAFVVQLVTALDVQEVFGDILAFLPTEATIRAAVEKIRQSISPERADVFALLAATEPAEKEQALAARARGDKRKIVVSTNLAETSLTVEGVRFVVDSGLIAQSEWDTATASGSVPTLPHSQAGIRQRWGRVGRNAPGWVFPLYPRAAFDQLAKDTPPGSTRSNLEQLVMTAKAGGVDDLEAFVWPAAFDHPSLDDAARYAMGVFKAEVVRADAALTANGALDPAGDITPYGRELQRFTSGRSPAFALAIMYADQLACVPEVVTVLTLLEGQQLKGESVAGREHLLLDHRRWPADWRAEAHWRQAALSDGCRDDLDVALRIAAAWEYADTSTRPWDASATRRAWAEHWWISNDRLLKAAAARHEVLEALSPAMREDVKRLLDPRLAARTRAVICRAMRSYEYQQQQDATYTPREGDGLEAGTLAPVCRMGPELPSRVLALSRRKFRNQVLLSSVVTSLPWASDDAPSPMALLERAAAAGRGNLDGRVPCLIAWPVGARLFCRGEAPTEGVVQLTAIHQVIPGRPFPGFKTAAAIEESASDETAEDVPDNDLEALEVGGLTNLDGEPDSEAGGASDAAQIEGKWPTGSQRPPADAEAQTHGAVLDPTDPYSALETNDDDDTVDLAPLPPPVDVLREAAAIWDRAVQLPLVKLDERRSLPPDASILCTGYELNDSGQVVLQGCITPLRPETTVPWENDDPTYGSEIAVVSGPLLDDQSGIRLFFRQDGLGQFYLADSVASKKRLDVATSIDPRANTLIRDLGEYIDASAVVIPGPLGAPTISLVPQLWEQLRRTAEPRADGRYVARGTISWVKPGRPVRVTADTGRADGMAATFLVAPPVIRRSGIEPEVGRSVAMLLTPAQRAPLTVSAAVAQRVAGEYPGWFSWEQSGHGGLLIARRPLPVALYQRLTGIRTDEQWPRMLAAWFIGSHHLTVDSVWAADQASGNGAVVQLPDVPKDAWVVGTIAATASDGVTVQFTGDIEGFAPRDHLVDNREYAIGQDALAKVVGIDPGPGRYVLSLRHQVSVPLTFPGYWQQAVWDLLDLLRIESGCRLWIEKPATLQVQSDRLSVLTTGVRTLTELLSSPAAIVTIPQGAEGQVRGRGHINLQRWASLPDVLYCGFPKRGRELVVVARTSAALRRALDAITPTARILLAIVETNKNIQAIVDRHNDVRLQGRDAGRGWAVQVKTERALENLLRHLRVSGQLVEVQEAVVADAATGLRLSDWQHHDFTRAPVTAGPLPDMLDLAAHVSRQQRTSTGSAASMAETDELDAAQIEGIASMLIARPKAAGNEQDWIAPLTESMLSNESLAAFSSEEDIAYLLLQEVATNPLTHELGEVTYNALGKLLNNVLAALDRQRISKKTAPLFRPHLESVGFYDNTHGIRKIGSEPTVPTAPKNRQVTDGPRLNVAEVVESVAVEYTGRVDGRDEDAIADIYMQAVATAIRRDAASAPFASVAQGFNKLLAALDVATTPRKLGKVLGSHFAANGLQLNGNDLCGIGSGPADMAQNRSAGTAGTLASDEALAELRRRLRGS